MLVRLRHRQGTPLSPPYVARFSVEALSQPQRRSSTVGQQQNFLNGGLVDGEAVGGQQVRLGGIVERGMNRKRGIAQRPSLDAGKLASWARQGNLSSET